MKTIRTMLPYLTVNALAFYALPFCIADTGSAMAVLLFGLPLICFFTALWFNTKHAFHLLYPILVCVLFAPSILIFYNQSATGYIGIYAVIALLGNCFGLCANKLFRNFHK